MKLVCFILLWTVLMLLVSLSSFLLFNPQPPSAVCPFLTCYHCKTFLFLTGWNLKRRLNNEYGTFPTRNPGYSALGRKIPVLSGKFRSRVENSGFRQKIPGYAHRQLSWKIPPQAGCGPAAQCPWPGILGNPFCSAGSLLSVWLSIHYYQ